MMRKLIFALLIAPSAAVAGDFGDAAIELENRVLHLQGRIEILEGTISEMDQRLQELELGIEEPDPDQEEPDPNPIPPVESVKPGQEPFVQNRIPGEIQVENYDVGPAAYHDTSPGNQGGAYRTDDVDIKAVGSDILLGFTADGEFLEFTVGAEAGIYDLWLRVAAKPASPGSVKVSLDGSEIATLVVPSTGGWDQYLLVQALGVEVLRTGNQILRLDLIGGPKDIDWIKFVPPGEAINRAPTDLMLCDSLDSNPEACDQGANAPS